MLSQLSYTPVSYALSRFRLGPSKLNNINSPKRSGLVYTGRLSSTVAADLLLRKELIHPHVLVGMPCYDFTPIAGFTLGSVLLAVRLPTSGAPNSHGVTGGVYKARERIHRGMLIRDY